jgi:hypothetical protein
LKNEEGIPIELGHGAIGVTYKAFDVLLERPAALKIINARFIGDDSARHRFVREARAAGSVRHPNVASVFHLGETGGNYFYAMEFVEGETLEKLIQRSGRLETDVALEVVGQVAVTRHRTVSDFKGCSSRSAYADQSGRCLRLDQRVGCNLCNTGFADENAIWYLPRQLEARPDLGSTSERSALRQTVSRIGAKGPIGGGESYRAYGGYARAARIGNNKQHVPVFSLSCLLLHYASDSSDRTRSNGRRHSS